MRVNTKFAFHRQSSELSKESLQHLEEVFHATLGKDQKEFTIKELKKIVPSKNVSKSKMNIQ